MDILVSKQYKEYDYTSRYVSFPLYYNTKDNKYIYGTTKQLSENSPFISHLIKDNDTLDSLALYYYGRPDYYWIIADFNRIQDPFIKLKDKFIDIKIPSISNIYYEDN